MNKRSVRAFAFGILLAVSLIGSSYFFFDSKESTAKLDKESAKNLLEKQNYIVLSKSEYDKLKANSTKQPATETKKEAPPAKSEKKVTDTTKDKEKQKDLNKTVTYKLKVVSGMTPSEISVFLKNANIIEDEEKFDAYLTENGYSTKIQLGTFKLTSDMSFEEIAKVITKS